MSGGNRLPVLATIPIDLIRPGDRLRGVDDEQVESLMSSIAEVGLLNPVTVYRLRVIHDHIAVDGYGIVAGLHRIEACKRLGLVEIDANIVDISGLQRQIAECDENLCGPKLSKAERARFTERRKQAYEALHPEARAVTERGGPGRGKTTDNLSTVSTPPYADDQAAKTGVDPRTVRRDAERGTKIAEGVLTALSGSQWDKGAVLDILKKLSHAEQRQALQRVQSGVSPSFKAAFEFIRGDEERAEKAPTKAVVRRRVAAAAPQRPSHVVQLSCLLRTMRSVMNDFEDAADAACLTVRWDAAMNDDDLAEVVDFLSGLLSHQRAGR